LLWLYGENRNSEAYPMMKKALEIWPNDSILLAYMANLEMQTQQNREKGKFYMEKAFENSNNDSDWLYQIKGCLWFDFLNEKEEGLACLEKAVSIKRNAANLTSLAWRIVDTDITEAEKLCDEAQRLGSEDADIIYVIAEIWMKQGRWVEGIEIAQKGCKLEPSNANLYALLGFAHSEVKEFDKALQYYNKSMELGFHDKAYIYASIGECYYKLGDLQKAREHANKAIDINPNDLDVIKLLEQLNANEQ
jgi:tetratricopeptide (TPR) repeat protein